MNKIVVKTYNFDAEHETHLIWVRLRAWHVQKIGEVG
jgi:hypothetical protein